MADITNPPPRDAGSMQEPRASQIGDRQGPVQTTQHDYPGAPGPVWTPLNPADAPACKVAQFGAGVDMHRPAQPQELSPAYVFLAAPCCASHITGIAPPVAGSVGE